MVFLVWTVVAYMWDELIETCMQQYSGSRSLRNVGALYWQTHCRYAQSPKGCAQPVDPLIRPRAHTTRCSYVTAQPRGLGSHLGCCHLVCVVVHLRTHAERARSEDPQRYHHRCANLPDCRLCRVPCHHPPHRPSPSACGSGCECRRDRQAARNIRRPTLALCGRGYVYRSSREAVARPHRRGVFGRYVDCHGAGAHGANGHTRTRARAADHETHRADLPTLVALSLHSTATRSSSFSSSQVTWFGYVAADTSILSLPCLARSHRLPPSLRHLSRSLLRCVHGQHIGMTLGLVNCLVYAALLRADNYGQYPVFQSAPVRAEIGLEIGCVAPAFSAARPQL